MRPRSDRPRLVYLTTAPTSMDTLMRGHFRYMKDAGFEVVAVSSPGAQLARVAEREGIDTVAIPIDREVRPNADLRSLYHLIRLFRECKPDIVNAGTPKAGLLGMVAAWATRVPVRIYTLRGLRLETKKGLSALILHATECLAGLAATVVIPVSKSLRTEHKARRIWGSRKSVLIADGSSNGVHWSRFAEIDQGHVARLILPSGEPADPAMPVLGCIGRIVKDKGVEELVRAFKLVQQEEPKALLVMVGAFEDGDAISDETRNEIMTNQSILVTGFVADTSQYYPLFDVLLFPSFREGFPNVPLEAACAQVPTIGFDVTGTRDAVVHGTTGYLVSPGSAQELADRALTYIRNPTLRREHGRRASERARSQFGQEQIWSGLSELYREQLRLNS